MSTMSSASFSPTSSELWMGERGRAMRPIQRQARCRRNLSLVLTSSCGLQDTEWSNKLHERVDPVRLGRELDNAVVGADVQNLTLELVAHEGNSPLVLMLVAERLPDSEVAGVVVFPQ